MSTEEEGKELLPGMELLVQPPGLVARYVDFLEDQQVDDTTFGTELERALALRAPPANVDVLVFETLHPSVYPHRRFKVVDGDCEVRELVSPEEAMTVLEALRAPAPELSLTINRILVVAPTFVMDGQLLAFAETLTIFKRLLQNVPFSDLNPRATFRLQQAIGMFAIELEYVLSMEEQSIAAELFDLLG